MKSRLGIILLIAAICTGCNGPNGHALPCQRIKSQLGNNPSYTNKNVVGATGAPPQNYSAAYQAKLLQEYQQYDCEDR